MKQKINLQGLERVGKYNLLQTSRCIYRENKGITGKVIAGETCIKPLRLGISKELAEQVARQERTKLYDRDTSSYPYWEEKIKVEPANHQGYDLLCTDIDDGLNSIDREAEARFGFNLSDGFNYRTQRLIERLTFQEANKLLISLNGEQRLILERNYRAHRWKRYKIIPAGEHFKEYDFTEGGALG